VSECCASKASDLETLARRADQRRVLLIVAGLNGAMFLAGFAASLIAGSAALMADSVDMLADATVYGLSVFAIDKSERWKAGAASAKGLFMLALGVAVIVQIGTRLSTGVPPVTAIMLVMASLALVVNLLSVVLIWRFRAADMNVASTWECSRNDALANVGVLLAAGAVALTGSFWPDILVGAAIAALFLRSAFRMLVAAWPILRGAPGPAPDLHGHAHHGHAHHGHAHSE
jgi:Co/Zn/Cd efflux system component